jgi:iron complex transport system substrate-binding protein
MTAARRRSAALLAVPVAALTLAACGEVTPEAGAGEAQTITVTDDQDREVTIEGPVERAVVINSYGNEFVRAIGAGDTVVGVDRTSLDRLPYLPVEDDAIVAEGLDQLNYEAIAELDPDVVVLPRNAVWQEAEQQLSGFGIPVVVATAWDAHAVEETVNLLGEVFGEQAGAQAVLDFESEIRSVLDEKLADVEPRSVYLETVDPYLTVLPGSGFHDMIVDAGGTNIFEDASGGDAQEELTVDPAEVVLRAPDLVFHEFEPSAEPNDRFAAVREDLSSRPGWKGLDAVADDSSAVANGWATSALGKSIGALYLATWLHPEAMGDVDPDTYLERWVTEFQDTEFTSADDYVRGPGE